MALRDRAIVARLEFLAALLVNGRFDEIHRRLTGRHRRDSILREFRDSPRPLAGARSMPLSFLRIAAFVHESGLSGAPLSLLDLATRLTQRKLAQVMVLAPSEGPITAACQSAGLEVAIHGIELRSLLTRRRWDKAVAHLATLMRPFAPSIVHANTIMTAPALAAARSSGIPALLNVREDGPDDGIFGFLPRDIAMEAFQALRTASEVVFVSQASHTGWRPYLAAELSSVIPNALPSEEAASSEQALTRSRLGIDDSTLLLLCVGSYCERKGQIDLVDAITRLPDGSRAGVRVVMAGEAEPVYLAKLRRRIAGLDPRLRHTFSLLPTQPRLADLYRAADIFVCCSRSESFPRVTIEAMRAGLPIVTTPVSGIVEQLNSDEALFYPPGDTKRLADAIARLTADSTLRGELGRRAALAFARHADFDAMVGRYVQAYRRMLEKSTRCAMANEARR